MIRALRRYRLGQLQRKLDAIEYRIRDLEDMPVNERNADAVEEDLLRARWRRGRVQSAIEKVKAKLIDRPSPWWWLTKAGRKAKQRRDGWDFGLLLLRTRPPEEVLTYGVGLSPFNSDDFNDGVRAAVRTYVEMTRAKQ